MEVKNKLWERNKMKITNNCNIPEPLYRTIAKKIYKPKENRYSVTALIGPPLVRTLTIEKWDELVSDASEYLWRILGIAVHSVLDTDSPALYEHKMETILDGHTVVGVADVIDKDFLEDYKVTSTYAFGDGIKPEWTQQLNMYAWLRELERRKDNSIIPIRYLKLNAILRDWIKAKAVRDNYPSIPFQSFYPELWNFEKQQEFVSARLKDHLENPRRECLPDEKWQRPTCYAIMKQGRKSAVCVTNPETKEPVSSLEEAENVIVLKKLESGYKKGTIYVEKREGDCVKCKDYCAVRTKCPFNTYNKEKG